MYNMIEERKVLSLIKVQNYIRPIAFTVTIIDIVTVTVRGEHGRLKNNPTDQN